MSKHWTLLFGFALAISATSATAQYAAPVMLPDMGGCGTSESLQSIVGLALDGSGGPPYPAAFCTYFVTDGTPQGTRFIENGPDDAIDIAAIPGGVGAYLVADDPDSPFNKQLYYTDGTESGTHIMAALIPAFPDGIRKIHGFVQGSIVLETQNTSRLVVSDGTLAGTHEVVPGGAGRTIEDVSIGLTQGFVDVGDAQGSHIWRFGPAPADTRLLTASVTPAFYNAELAAFGDRACFVAGQSPVGSSTYSALYCTDGTIAGTSAITQLAGGTQLGMVSSEAGFQRFGSRLMFMPVWKPNATSNEIYQSPWSTDGTEAGTQLMTTHFSLDLASIGTADGRIFFSSYPVFGGIPFWASDGTTGNTAEVARMLWQIAGIYSTNTLNPTLGSAVFFVSSGNSERRLQRSDGTATGTFPMPLPAGLTPDSWSPSIEPKPAILGTHLLVEASGVPVSGTWSYDLDPIFEGVFD